MYSTSVHSHYTPDNMNLSSRCITLSWCESNVHVAFMYCRVLTPYRMQIPGRRGIRC